MTILRRHKLKVYIDGHERREHKSDSLEYIMRTIEEYKKQFPPERIEFRRSRSEVMVVKKPNIIFRDLPDWHTTAKYGRNSDGGWYLIGKDKVIRIYEL